MNVLTIFRNSASSALVWTAAVQSPRTAQEMSTSPGTEFQNRKHQAAEKKGKLDSYLDYLSDKVHWRLKEARIVGGYVRENQAVLLIKGSGPVIDHVKGQVTLTRENDGWKISDEVYQVGE